MATVTHTSEILVFARYCSSKSVKADVVATTGWVSIEEAWSLYQDLMQVPGTTKVVFVDSSTGRVVPENELLNRAVM